MKLFKHIVHRIPPCAHIAQELQVFELDRLLPFFEPPTRVALGNKLFEVSSMLTWSLNGPDHCASCLYGIGCWMSIITGRGVGIVIIIRWWGVSIIVHSPISHSTYHMPRTKIYHVCKAHDSAISCIKGNVMGCQHWLKLLHYGPVVWRIVHGEVSHLK